MVTGTFPASSTEYPRVASFLFRSATRIALGPMSTPRRPAPRSRGTPMMLMVLADILNPGVAKNDASPTAGGGRASLEKGWSHERVPGHRSRQLPVQAPGQSPRGDRPH